MGVPLGEIRAFSVTKMEWLGPWGGQQDLEMLGRREGERGVTGPFGCASVTFGSWKNEARKGLGKSNDAWGNQSSLAAGPKHYGQGTNHIPRWETCVGGRQADTVPYSMWPLHLICTPLLAGPC